MITVSLKDDTSFDVLCSTGANLANSAAKTVTPQLLNQSSAAAGPVPVYLPANQSASNEPYSTLFGRPVSAGVRDSSGTDEKIQRECRK